MQSLTLAWGIKAYPNWEGLNVWNFKNTSWKWLNVYSLTSAKTFKRCKSKNNKSESFQSMNLHVILDCIFEAEVRDEEETKN